MLAPVSVPCVCGMVCYTPSLTHGKHAKSANSMCQYGTMSSLCTIPHMHGTIVHKTLVYFMLRKLWFSKIKAWIVTNPPPPHTHTHTHTKKRKKKKKKKIKAWIHA